MEPKAFWSPDFKMMVNASNEEGPMGVKPTTRLCEVGLKGTVTWETDGLKVIGMSAKDADDAVARY